ncbi:MAG: hypothetical protein Q4F76_05985 [Lachnospiraceae bacterium]|nr:hypothetical protein [Lachnospiraceae bacterium]
MIPKTHGPLTNCAHYTPIRRKKHDDIAYEKLRKQILIKGAHFAPSIGLSGSRSGSGNMRKAGKNKKQTSLLAG